jgi:hypothetical protein
LRQMLLFVGINNIFSHNLSDWHDTECLRIKQHILLFVESAVFAILISEHLGSVRFSCL